MERSFKAFNEICFKDFSYVPCKEIYPLEKIADTLREFGREHQIHRFIVFGSYARGEATADSDVDVVYFPSEVYGLWETEALRQELCYLLKKDVDFLSDGDLESYLKTHPKGRLADNIFKDGVEIAV